MPKREKSFSKEGSIYANSNIKIFEYRIIRWPLDVRIAKIINDENPGGLDNFYLLDAIGKIKIGKVIGISSKGDKTL